MHFLGIQSFNHGLRLPNSLCFFMTIRFGRYLFIILWKVTTLDLVLITVILIDAIILGKSS